MPLAVARAAVADGRPVHIVAIRGEADQSVEQYSHQWVSWGEIGAILRGLRQDDCREMVIIGSVTRPDLTAIKFDFGAILNLPRLLKLVVAGGDDAVLTNVVRFFEDKGHVVKGAHEIARDLVASVGTLSSAKPRRGDELDIVRGFQVVSTMGDYDIGQACVSAREHVIAVEAAEGTDRMLNRCGELRQWGKRVGRKRVGVLVKCPKPRQELRVDMPVIGTKTVELAAKAGLAGIAILAGKVMIADRAEMLALADAEGLFVVARDLLPTQTDRET